MRTARGSSALIAVIGALAGLAGARVAVAAPPVAGQPVKAAFADVSGQHAEVRALQVLRSLAPTAAQLDALRDVSAKTMQEAPLRKLVKVSDRYRKTLRSLRQALLAGDDEAVDDLCAVLHELNQKEPPELEEGDLTDAARAQAPKLARALSARQVADYLASVAEFPDPVEQLVAGCEAGRKLRGPRWDDHRDDVAYLVGWLAAGVDAKKEAAVRAKAVALLNKAHRVDAKAYAAGREALFREARQVVGDLGPTDVLRHYMERVFAELLSNYRLAEAVEAWRKRG